MAEFAYNKAKNTSISYTPFKLNYDVRHLGVSYKENVNSRSKSKVANKLATKLRNLMSMCRKNFHHAQE